MTQTRSRSVVGLVLAILPACKHEPPGTVEVVVAAAASLRGVLPEIAASYERAHPGTRITVTYGASGDLGRQVAAGAPIDVVAFAGAAPVDDLVAHGLADSGSRKVIATNSLVLIGPRGGPRFTFATLTQVPATDKVAIGDPRSVPAGQYAKAALERLREWTALHAQLVYGSDVAAVLAYARRGEVDAAIVYKTEIQGVPDVELLDELAPGVAPRAEVVVARATSSHAREAAADFLAALEGPDARKALDARGFGRP